METGRKVSEEIVILGVTNTDDFIPKEDLSFLVNVEHFKKKIFYRAIYQGVHYQSKKYCRLTKRNNYTVMYDKNKVGFIEYFMEVEVTSEIKNYYAVMRQLLCKENLSVSGNFGDVNVELEHMLKFTKKR